MSGLTEHGRETIGALAERHGLSQGAVEQMAAALARGGGTMAQFDIPELGGSGQWMAGGMTMVGDMFNSGLKMRVESLCADLTAAGAEAPLFARPQTIAGAAWWPEELGSPAAVGGQNQARYAYFPQARRLAFDPGNGAPLILLDTLDHRIGGFSQQQSGIGDGFHGVTFSSQSGQFPLSALPRAGEAAAQASGGAAPETAPRAGVQAQGQFQGPALGQAQFQGGAQGQFQGTVLGQAQGQSQSQSRGQSPAPATPPRPAPAARPAPEAPAETPKAPPAGNAADLLALLEKLAALRDAGILTEQEFTDKKAEILARL